MPSFAEQCRLVFLYCDEFTSHARLVALFTLSDDLRPFADKLPEADTFGARVDLCIAYMVKKKLIDGRSLLEVFIQTLATRYDLQDQTRKDLLNLLETLFSLTSIPSALDIESKSPFTISEIRGETEASNEDKKDNHSISTHAEIEQLPDRRFYSELATIGDVIHGTPHDVERLIRITRETDISKWKIYTNINLSDADNSELVAALDFTDIKRLISYEEALSSFKSNTIASSHYREAVTCLRALNIDGFEHCLIKAMSVDELDFLSRLLYAGFLCHKHKYFYALDLWCGLLEDFLIEDNLIPAVIHKNYLTKLETKCAPSSTYKNFSVVKEDIFPLQTLCSLYGLATLWRRGSHNYEIDCFSWAGEKLFQQETRKDIVLVGLTKSYLVATPEKEGKGTLIYPLNIGFPLTRNDSSMLSIDSKHIKHIYWKMFFNKIEYSPQHAIVERKNYDVSREVGYDHTPGRVQGMPIGGPIYRTFSFGQITVSFSKSSRKL